MSRYQVTDSQIEQFQDDGFLFVESLFDAEETDYLLTNGKTNEENAGNAHRDGTSGTHRVHLKAPREGGAF